MVPASLYLGFAAAILWVGEGTYLTSAARSQANDHKLHEGTVVSLFNGEFWAIFATHQDGTIALLSSRNPVTGVMVFVSSDCSIYRLDCETGTTVDKGKGKELRMWEKKKLHEHLDL
ncbi:hypothetical protein L2E82_38297 [Cichorium intybus]|uniref:Uncharacterized protein n=1 Tax=Cichorium intybus TaxID=13427 RepID=A0ACB9AK52_CICIN|nr:hypothetical protein L2E82_38297 [Cichorium intybus]